MYFQPIVHVDRLLLKFTVPLFCWSQQINAIGNTKNIFTLRENIDSLHNTVELLIKDEYLDLSQPHKRETRNVSDTKILGVDFTDVDKPVQEIYLCICKYGGRVPNSIKMKRDSEELNEEIQQYLCKVLRYCI